MSESPRTPRWHRRVSVPSWDTKVRCSCGAEFDRLRDFDIHESNALAVRREPSPLPAEPDDASWKELYIDAKVRIEELEAALARALRSVCNERHGGAFTDGHRCEECERYYPEMFR